jgi:hypothetical protein
MTNQVITSLRILNDEGESYIKYVLRISSLRNDILIKVLTPKSVRRR